MTRAFNVLLLLLCACGGPVAILIDVTVQNVPEGTQILRATSYLNDQPEQQPAEFSATEHHFFIRLPTGAATGGARYSLEVEALAEDRCTFALATGQSTLGETDRVIAMTIPFGRRMDFHSCALKVQVSGAGLGYVQSDVGAIFCGSLLGEGDGGRQRCQSQLQQGGRVELLATPSSSSTFDGWTGACQGQTSARCELIMSGPVSIVGHFGVRAN